MFGSICICICCCTASASTVPQSSASCQGLASAYHLALCTNHLIAAFAVGWGLSVGLGPSVSQGPSVGWGPSVSWGPSASWDPSVSQGPFVSWGPFTWLAFATPFTAIPSAVSLFTVDPSIPAPQQSVRLLAAFGLLPSINPHLVFVGLLVVASHHLAALRIAIALLAQLIVRHLLELVDSQLPMNHLDSNLQLDLVALQLVRLLRVLTFDLLIAGLLLVLPLALVVLLLRPYL